MTRARPVTAMVLTCVVVCGAHSWGCRRAAESEAAPQARAAPGPPVARLEVETIGRGSGPIVVLLHGYGTPPGDLVPLARSLSSDPRLESHRFVMPAGRMPAGFGGRMWWPLPPREVREAETLRGARDVASEHPPELPASRRAVLALVSDLQDRTGLAPERIALGGFSQGAMLAVDASLHREGGMGPVFALSGSVVAERDWRPLLPRARGVKVFVSHGRHDSVLPFSGAERLRDLLGDAGAEVRFHPFDGDHEIGDAVLREVADFLADALPSGS